MANLKRSAWGGTLLLAFWMTAAAVFAQSPAVSPKEADAASAQQKQMAAQPLNNQPVWSEVRSGAPQVTTVRGRETNVLIQPQGQTWRAARVPLLTIGGLIVAAALIGLTGFYAWRGPLTVEEKPRGRIIRRFSPADRWAHWLLAITWVTLAITGLILSLGKTILLPLIGYTLFSWLATLAKDIHNFIGPILIFAVPWMFIRFVRDNGFGMDDVRWFINIVGYFKGHEYPSGKFNAGEKLVFWGVLVVLSTVLVVTGLVLVFPNFDQFRQTMQISNIIHMCAAYVAIGLAFVHIYLGTIGMTGAYRAMRYGYVDAAWAEHHHARWYQDVVAGKAREKFVDPREVPPEALPTNGSITIGERKTV
jgi:formate dehydrogenase subunit gamma